MTDDLQVDMQGPLYKPFEFSTSNRPGASNLSPKYTLTELEYTVTELLIAGTACGRTSN